MSMPPTFHAIVVAAGKGLRSGLDGPKQFAALGGKPLLRWSVEAFAAHPRCAGISVVVAPDGRDRAAEALRHLSVTIVDGGAERQDSVRAGMAAAGSAALVLVHDAARPGLTAEVIDRLLAALDDAECDGAVPVLPVADTLARDAGADASIVGAAALGDVVDRTALVRIQTPQAFRRDALKRAHGAWAGGNATDDAQMIRAAGGRVALVAGSRQLDKITLPGDLEAMALLLQAPAAPTPRIAVGMGYDVHRLVPGDGVWIGGVWIAHSHRLEGHSDADVLLHAITDALLGALGDGDIGQHFPPNDPQWRGADSARFLSHAVDLAARRSATIAHVDATLICEAPKFGPHRAAVITRIAGVLGIAEDRVSMKATTTERLGFTGRREGIAAQAVVTLAIPPL
jgi:2-C-methyl-D-erythritol 4-phosphate cytidylyltransferase/2-C-methyl-D-erythritol 2,4-cyclodiphosphate synthase